MGKTLGYGEITVANMTEPFTVMLTNEAQQFATDSNRKVTSAQSYYTDIIVIRGSQERTDYTIGNITSGSGITVSKSSKRVTFSVSAGSVIGADTGVIEIPITLDGQTVKKQFSWSCGKQGPQGVKGVDGNSFAWNMLSETNCGKKHWGTESSGGKYSVEDFITEDNINAVKLICTEAISTSNWSYVSFKDIKMLKQLKPSTKYTLSYDIKANRSGAISHSICKGDVSNFCTNIVVVNNIIGNETWQHISVVLTTNDLKTTPTNEILYLGRNALSNVGYSIIKNLKLVEGDIDTPWSPSQSDIEGKGVIETVQYYLATSQASGVTSSTSGWSTDITTQKLTSDKKYLWNCYQTKYSDGTSEPISTPKVIGVYGDKGTSTKIIRTSYEYTQTNIDKFSTSGYSRVWRVNDATTGLKVGDSVLLKVKNTTKGSDCLIFANITAIPSNYSLTCTSYGVIDNGSDGQDGAGFHWNLLKYSGDLSKQVLGGAGTYTATVESIEDKTTPSGQAEKITYTVQGTGGKFIQTGKYIKEGNIKQGKTYTVSVWCKCSSIKSTGVINAEFLDNKTYVNPTLSTEWQQYVVTGVANKDVTSTSSASAISFYYNDNMSVGDIFYISSPKVEEGDKASPWCTTYEETLAKNLTITPSSQYFKSTDGGKTFAPNTITIKPTIQGEINFGKWQYSIDGGVSFADVVSGQKGLTINNNVLSISKDSSLYSDAVTMVTFRAVANDSSFYDTCSIAKIYDVSDIGDGRNLLWNSNFAKTDEAITGTTNSWWLHTRGTNLVASIDTSTKHNGFNTLKTVSAANGDKNSSNDLEWFAWSISERTSDNFHSKNQNYTLSFYAKASVTTDFIVRWGYDAYGEDTTRTLTTNWQKYEIKLHQTTSTYTISIIFKLLTAGTVWFSEFKLEKGSSATGYSPAPEDVQTAILSTKSEISDVSLKVDKNKQAIEQRVEKTTYQQDLNLVKGDISKANEGLNKWRYEIYPKSLFASEYQGKSTMGVFAKNTNLTPSQSVLINDTDFGKSWAYGDNYIGYALTFVKFSAAKSIVITFKHDDGAHLYLNGKLIGGDDTCNIGSGESLTLSFIQGWNCLEVVLNEKSGGEYIGLGTTISAISECQLMNCYYGTPVARQSHITNQLVENTTNIEGVTTTMQKVMTTVGGSDKIDEFVNNYNKTVENEKQFKKTIGETYTTKDEFNGLEIGGRNLLLGTKDFSSGTYKSTNNFAFSNPINGFTVLKAKLPDGQQYYDPFSQSITYEPNTKYTLSFYAKADSTCGIGSFFYNIGNDGKYVDGCTVTTLTTSWKRYSITWATGNVSRTANILPMRLQGTGNTWCYMYGLKFEKGSKATDWTPAPEDNEINGQNLVSNLPANWEQGTFQDSKTNVGCDYNTNKASMTTRIRVKELVPVSGTITISNAYSNQSKKPIQNMITAFDVNKKWLGNSYVSTDWNDFPRIVDMKDAKYIAVVVRYKDESAITPSDISQICLKIERGTSATPFTLAPEDVNGKIVNVETIANQTAKKFEWIVKGESTSSNLVLTDNALTAIANNINLTGKVTFSWLNNETQKKITDANTWVTNNGSSTTSLNSMVKKWTDGAVSDTTQINGGWIKANTITASKIAVGDFTNYADINESNTYGFTVEKTADGVWFSKDGSKLGRDNYISKMYSCEPGQTFYVEYDISNTIKDSTEYKAAGTMLFGCDGTQTVKWYQRRGAVVGTAAGTVTHMSQQLTMPSGTRFFYVVLQIEGHPPFTGTLKIRNLSVRKAVTGAVIVDGSITADKIATDAIKSRNYISSGGTQGSFLNLSDGSFTSPNLSWDSNGNLIAKNANIIGNLTAGTVGEWKIDKYIYSRDKMFFDINKHNGQSIYNKNSTNNLFLGDGKVSSFYWFTTQNNTFIIENGNSPQYATGPAGISFGTNIAQGQIELYESVYPGNIIQDYEQTSHTSELSISGSKISFSYYDSNGSSFSDSPYTYIMADYARFYGDIFVQGSITTDEGVDVGGKLQASSIATKNGGLIETAGTVYGGGEIQCGGGQMRIIGGNYGILLRNDGSDFYILSTDSGSPWGSWNSKRPFRINLANGIPYFEYGIIIPNENYLLGNGYQLARGTSWGGVCIGDDSKRLRLYGTSIWASHSISTSDENLKENFTTLDQYEEFYMNLNPIGFNYIGDYDGKKTHFGFGAHKIEDILESEGYDADKFAVVTHRPLVQEDIEKRFGKDVTVDIETEYGVSYAEFIALNTHMIQKTRRELTKVKQEKADLEARLQIIEAKLGL